MRTDRIILFSGPPIVAGVLLFLLTSEKTLGFSIMLAGQLLFVILAAVELRSDDRRQRQALERELDEENQRLQDQDPVL